MHHSRCYGVPQSSARVVTRTQKKKVSRLPTVVADPIGPPTERLLVLLTSSIQSAIKYVRSAHAHIRYIVLRIS